MPSASWRLLLILAALLLAAGGPQHPRGSMVEMLAHPAWVRAHLLMLGGFVALLLSLTSFRKTLAPGSTSHRWAGFAILGTALQAVEMGLHTAAVFDGANLAAGASTPILSLHLGASVLFYPIFATALIGLLVVTARERSLGSVYFAWIGIIGLVAHGFAPLLVVGLGLNQASVLFPIFMLFAVWALLAAILTRGTSGTEELDPATA